jgi:hypothetical protein
VLTVVETPAFLSDAQSLGMSEVERLAIVTWIAANPLKTVLAAIAKTYKSTKESR